jgi:hypothetical protein
VLGGGSPQGTGAGGESLARWQSPICPLVAGLPRDHGEFILQRVSQIAGDVGVPLATDHCRGNFYVVVTANPEALLSIPMPWDFGSHTMKFGIWKALYHTEQSDKMQLSEIKISIVRDVAP